jgi:hypothetical protein
VCLGTVQSRAPCPVSFFFLLVRGQADKWYLSIAISVPSNQRVADCHVALRTVPGPRRPTDSQPSYTPVVPLARDWPVHAGPIKAWPCARFTESTLPNFFLILSMT